MICGLFDDHYEAFPTWREASLKGLTCLHVDAHLDVMGNCFSDEVLEGIAASKTRAELDRFRGHPRMPWGGFHCGNYLFPALIDGTVEELIWLVPAFVIKGENFLDGVRQEVQNWVDLSFEEYRGFTAVEGRVEGTLGGRRFVVCTEETLPEFTPEQRQNLALDIDVDYFVRVSDDKVWSTPHTLRQLLDGIEPVALTIAYSVEGGYTPVEDRYLGEITRDVFSGQPDAWRSELQSILALEDKPPEEREAGLEALLEGAPDWLRAALLHKLGRSEEAAAIDPEQKEKPLNRIARYLHRKDYMAGLELLEELGDKSTERHYLEVFLALGAREHAVQKEALNQLLEADLTEVERATVLRMKAGTCCELGLHREALDLLDEAKKLEPDNAELYVKQAVAYQGRGDRKQAARALRKAIKLSQGMISSLDIMLSAAKLYDQMGQKALARSIRREERPS